MHWSRAAMSIWAKTSPSDGAWLPLVTHLADTAGMAGALFDSYLSPGLQKYLAQQLGVTVPQARALTSFLASCHDIGKATPDFARQAKVVQPELVSHMRDAGLRFPPDPPERLGHHLTGQVVLTDWLRERKLPRHLPPALGGVIGGHHGRNPDSLELERARSHPALLGGPEWEAVRNEILDGFADLTGVTEVLPQLASKVPITAQALLTGIVIMADWMASNVEFFGYLDPSPTSIRVDRALAQLHLPQQWVPPKPSAVASDLFALRFPALQRWPIRPLQQAAFELASKCSQPGLFILEAEPGNGKTEAALLASEVLAYRFGLGGLFIGLPTMATADPMFDRIMGWLESALGEHSASVTLAHSKASLNDAYSGLLREAWRGTLYDEGPLRSGPHVNSWFTGRKRSGLAQFVIGTVDQALFMGLKAKHLVLRHLGLASKVVVIDEVHAADDYMREYLKIVLMWLAAYGTPVILMSATLPPTQRDELLSAYATGAERPVGLVSDQSDAYPRITSYAAGTLQTAFVPAKPDTTVQVRRMNDDLNDLVALISSILRDGGCAGVICNTVARAQEAYAALKATLNDDVVLLHSRFIATDRTARASSIVAELGRDGVRPNRRIVVGTQVLEQSLDIDFDFLVTDVAPVDLVLQRVGRLHRHDRSRPAPLAEAQLWLRGVDDWGGETAPKLNRGSKYVYGVSRLLRTLAVLHEGEIRLPSDVPRLVRQGYNPELSPPPGWESAWATAEAAATRHSAEAKQRASTFLLEPSWRKSNLTGLIDVVATDPDTAAQRGRSQVRDSDEGLEVIALFRDIDGLLRVPTSAPRFGGTIVPEGFDWSPNDESLARAMAACTLPLPKALSHEGVIDQVIRELEARPEISGWPTSRWLAGQLALVFDTHGNARLASQYLHYDPDQGLMVIEKEEPQP